MLVLLAVSSCLFSLSLGLAPSDNPATGSCLCANAGVNVRSTACTTGSILGLLAQGACVQSRGTKLTACGHTWFKVLYNGAEGWIAGEYLNTAASTRCSGGAAAATTVPGLTQQCLDCICEVEGCKTGCHWDVYSDSCGYFQIKTEYYSDCSAPGAGWKACSDDKACATQCVKNYLKRYGTYCTGGRTPTCEDYAKIHNGGPKGCQGVGSVNTYWSKVQACLNRIG